ncbi:MAG TPA: tripartite tricarboxylate transporter TctB family protein [Devosia sp.]|nr:tripartite tricarboxylate transporter TctB family protein [Devosia sp.]
MNPRSDLAVGLVIAALGAAIIVASRDLTPLVGAAFGAGLFPTILGIVMLAGGLLMALRPLLSPAHLEAGRAMGDITAEAVLTEPRKGKPLAALWAIVGTALSAWAFEPLGFVVYCTLLLAGMLLLLGARPIAALMLSSTLALGAHLVFVYGLLVPLPTGILSFLLR